MSTNSLITTRGGASPMQQLGPGGAEERPQRRVDPRDRPFRDQRAVGHLVDPPGDHGGVEQARNRSTSPSAHSSPS
jgi:hypothetical protein